MKEHIAANHLLAGAVEEFDDGGFLFGQPDLSRIVANEHLGGGPEGVGPNLEYGILALFVLS